MKKRYMLIVCALLIFNTVGVSAQRPIDTLIEEVTADEQFDKSLIDVENIVYAEITSYINLAKKIEATSYYLYIPSLNGNDYYTAGFDKNKYVATTKNFIATEPLKYFSYDEAKSLAAENGLSKPENIKAILTHGRIGLFAYDILCDGETYIIPYYFTNDSTYNIVQDEDCELEIGIAYTIDEFVEKSEKEHNLYNAYMSKKNKEKENSTVLDKNENDIKTGTENNDKIVESKKEDINNEDKELVKKDDKIKDDKKIPSEETNATYKLETSKDDESKREETVVHFVDVPKNHWAYDEINALASNNIILGYGNGYFGVNDNVTYEQVSLLLKRQFNYEMKNKTATPASREDIIIELVKALNFDMSDVEVEVIDANFSDGAAVSKGNEKYIAYAIKQKIVVGYDRKLNLANNVTRAETACLMHRAINAND